MNMRYQPQGELKLAGNFLTKGLRLAVLPGVNRFYDAAYNSALTPSGTKPLVYPSGISAGFGLALGASNADVINTQLGGAFPAQGRTYFFRARRNGAGGGGLGRLFDKTSGTSGQFLYWQTSVSKLTYGFHTAGVERFASAAIPAIGEVFNVMVSHIHIGTTSTINIFVDGVPLLVDFTMQGALTDAANTNFAIGNRAPGNVRNWDGSIECCYVWDTVLGQREATALQQGPYQVFYDPSPSDILRNAISAVYANTSGSAKGVSNAQTIARSIASVVSSSMGTSVVSASARSVASTLAVSIATCSAKVHSASVVVTSAASISTSAAEAQSNSIVDVVANATGASDARAICLVIQESMASSLSTSEARAIVEMVVESFGSSQGTATVSGVAAGGFHYTAVGDRFSITIQVSPYSLVVAGPHYGAITT